MKKIILRLAIVICAGVLAFSSFRLFQIYQDYHAGTTLYQSVSDQYTTDAPLEATPGETGAVPSASTPGGEAGAPAVTAPLQVDFAALWEANPDVVGWIYCPGTTIDYPILQADDNDAYLRHMLDGSYNTAGSIFLDCSCAGDFSGANTIVYGHNMKNGSMFGCLPDYAEQEFYDEHPVIWIFTPEHTWQVELIAGGVISDEDDLYILLSDTPELRERVADIQSRSTFSPRWTGMEWPQVITFSTCSYEYEGARFVLLGVPMELS